MSKNSEIKKFEDRFEDEVVDVVAITGPSGVGAGKAGGAILWEASINIIAWRTLEDSKQINDEEVRLCWLVDDEELTKSRDILKPNSIVSLKVRRGKNSMMLIGVTSQSPKDEELENILEESMKPVFYKDEVLGQFELNKSIKIFDKKIQWNGEEGSLSFDLDEEDNMKASLETARVLFKDQKQWDDKIRGYAADKLLDLANEWLQDNDEADIDEITKEMFVNFMALESITVYPDGKFDMFFFDGDMFWGHCIIVTGNINGEFDSAEIAG
ncbi:DUF2262 domain-containing protein [Clostridium manihotivorum]|uniref:Uncharacterized protein n=1 Tax=Clostridium manihotivorum TaxID=2320868 RepID=A0A3R5QW59_9CLOT|nr:DUF2262 domain-containing protein [Clostridium manihotivorum]QAA33652.1 hypothetical protein C1I91_19535 [Clostridium manihotivorum]